MNKSIFIAICLVGVLLCSIATAATGVGTVISSKPGFFALRGGKQIQLALKDRVMETDVLLTDATGRGQIIFDDDSTTSLASSTRLELLSVVQSGTPQFRANVSTGLARFITGKIVEQNPSGFSVGTPRGTVGIRGTIFSVRAADGTVTIYVTSTTSGGVDFGGTTIPSGSRMVVGPDGRTEIIPMTPEENNAIEQQVAAGTVVASGEAETTEGGKESVFEESSALTDGLRTPAGNLDANSNASPEVLKNMTARIDGIINIIQPSGPAGDLVNSPYSLTLDLLSGQGSGSVNLRAQGSADPFNMGDSTFFAYESTSPINMALSASASGGNLALTGQHVITAADGFHIEYAAISITPAAEYNPIAAGAADPGYLFLSATAGMTISGNNISVSGNSGTFGYQFAHDPNVNLDTAVTGNPANQEVLKNAIINEIAVTGKINEITGEGVIVSK